MLTRTKRFTCCPEKTPHCAGPRPARHTVPGACIPGEGAPSAGSGPARQPLLHPHTPRTPNFRRALRALSGCQPSISQALAATLGGSGSGRWAARVGVGGGRFRTSEEAPPPSGEPVSPPEAESGRRGIGSGRGTRHLGPSLPEEPRFPRRLRRGGGWGARGRRRPGTGGGARAGEGGSGEGSGQQGARRERGGPGRGSGPGEGNPRPGRAYPAPRGPSTIAAAASHKGPGPPCPARRGGGAAGRGQTLHPPRRSPRRPGPPPPPGPQRPPPSRRRQRPPPLGRSAPPGGTGSEVCGAPSRRAWRGPPRGPGPPRGAGTAGRPREQFWGVTRHPTSGSAFRKRRSARRRPAPSSRWSRSQLQAAVHALVAPPPPSCSPALPPQDAGAPRAPGPAVAASLLSPCGDRQPGANPHAGTGRAP